MSSQSSLVSRPIKAESLLSFDWRELTALGVSPEEARSIAIALIVKRLMTLHERKLSCAGVPQQEARILARIIAKFDILSAVPTPREKQLISQYCPAICRSGLWRSQLLLRPS